MLVPTILRLGLESRPWNGKRGTSSLLFKDALFAFCYFLWLISMLAYVSEQHWSWVESMTSVRMGLDIEIKNVILGLKDGLKNKRICPVLPKDFPNTTLWRMESYQNMVRYLYSCQRDMSDLTQIEAKRIRIRSRIHFRYSGSKTTTSILNRIWISFFSLSVGKPPYLPKTLPYMGWS